MRSQRRVRIKGVTSADDAKALPYLRDDEEEKKMPESENIDLHGFDVGAEHASGWTLKNTQPKPPEAGKVDPNKVDALVVRDAGEVNRTQYERINELRLPLSDNGAQKLPLTIRANLAPDFKSNQPSNRISLVPPGAPNPVQRPAIWLREPIKMGLNRSYDEERYQQEARIIRARDRYVARQLKKTLANNPSLGATAIEAHGSGKVPYTPPDRGRVRYNPLIVPGMTYVANRFRPDPGPTETLPSEQMPGSVSSFFTPKADTYGGDFLEKLVTLNPQATQNALDRGAIFNPTFRNVQQYPSISAQRLDRFNVQ